MFRAYILTTFMLLLFSSKAQTNEGLKPYSFLHPEISATGIPAVELPAPDPNTLKALDEQDAKTGALPKFSRSIYTQLNLQNCGTWITNPDGSKLWMLHLKSKDALGLIPFYNRFYIPKNATLHVYNSDKSQVLGAFTHINNPESGYYCTGLIQGEQITLEYYQPAEISEQAQIQITEVGYAYRWINSFVDNTRDFGDAAFCEVNANCSEGNNFRNQQRSAVRILVQSSTGQGWCSGNLINNMRHDLTPYLLSAQHCAEGTSNNQYNQWVFYFNYEAPGCSNPSTQGTLANRFLVGCSKKADSNDNGGDSGSDFLLLQFNATVPTNYNPYFSGWNNTNTAPTSGVCFHHPEGDIKKISTYTTTATNNQWGSASGSHWRVRWASTPNGHGVTEPGSSGSCLYNSAGHIVGQLTGGDSYCQSPTLPDYFGKMSYNWTNNGSNSNNRLKPWLDANDYAMTIASGMEPACNLLNLFLKTDEHGSDIRWQIRNSANVVMYAAGPLYDTPNGVTYNVPLCLPDDCYTLTLFDSYGDGLEGNLTGDMKLTGNSGAVTYAQLSNPNFGAQVDFNFCYPVTNLSEITEDAIRVYPNPSSGIFYIQNGTGTLLKATLYDVTGRSVKQITTENNITTLDLSAENSGIYILEVLNANGRSTYKLVVHE